jgi:two-component system response regulator AtoC
MRPVEEALRKVARTDAMVLLLGESGAGKEVAALAVHRWSARAAGPFVAVNCAALTETLPESELFGHEKGAFTGAGGRRRARIELAEGGTFFLDEVAELRPELQVKLLRVLQERRFERVGGSQTLAANEGWIAATNRDLRASIEAGRFRDDLSPARRLPGAASSAPRTVRGPAPARADPSRADRRGAGATAPAARRRGA